MIMETDKSTQNMISIIGQNKFFSMAGPAEVKRVGAESIPEAAFARPLTNAASATALTRGLLTKANSFFFIDVIIMFDSLRVANRKKKSKPYNYGHFVTDALENRLVTSNGKPFAAIATTIPIKA